MVASTADTLADDARKPGFFGTWTGTPRDEATAAATYGLYARITANGGGATRFGAGRGTAVSNHSYGDAVVTTANHAAPALYTFTVPEAAVSTMTDHTQGLTASSASTALRFPTDRFVRIGSSYAQYLGHCDISIFRLWYRVLSAAEIAAERAHASWFMLNMGVTV